LLRLKKNCKLPATDSKTIAVIKVFNNYSHDSSDAKVEMNIPLQSLPCKQKKNFTAAHCKIFLMEATTIEIQGYLSPLIILGEVEE